LAEKDLYLFIILLHTIHIHNLLFSYLATNQKKSCLVMERRCDSGEDVEKPLYLPQPEDEYLTKSEHTLGPLESWTTAKITYFRDGEITGLRPVADRYSITFYISSESCARSLYIFRQSNEKFAISHQYVIQNNLRLIEIASRI
jgi:hypothetical protein